jgi:hypothetical protein
VLAGPLKVFITRMKARARYRVEAGEAPDLLVPLKFEDKHELPVEHYVKISKQLALFGGVVCCVL